MIHSDKLTMGRTQMCVETAAGGQLRATYITAVHHVLPGLCIFHFCLKVTDVPIKTLLKGMAQGVQRMFPTELKKTHHKFTQQHFSMQQTLHEKKKK